MYNQILITLDQTHTQIVDKIVFGTFITKYQSYHLREKTLYIKKG